MKNLFLFSISIFFFCCTSHELTEDMDDLEQNGFVLETNSLFNLSRDECSSSLLKLLDLVEKVDNHYSLGVSKGEALCLGVTEQEYENLVEGIKIVNAGLSSVANSGYVVIPQNNYVSEISLSRSAGVYGVERILYYNSELLPVANQPAKFLGPANIVITCGASSLLWSITCKEEGKGLVAAFNNFSDDNHSGRLVKSPLVESGKPVSWDWNVINGSGN